MESSRQEAFRKLREPCVELSSIGLKFRGHQATPTDVLKALGAVHKVLDELAGKGLLDEKLAEYAFFPLAHIFNESKRAPVNVLELAVNCLRILVAEGWKARLSPQMGKQLIILLTLIVGGTPGNVSAGQICRQKSIELEIAGFSCLSAIFDVLTGPTAEATIFHEIGTATVVDQTVYILLEAISGDSSDELCVSAAQALQALYRRVTDRVVLASIMPRTVSALTKVLKPTTQVRRSYKLISICLDILNEMLRMVLNDRDNAHLPEKATQPQKADERLVLDESWLKATATQIKLALTNVIQLRRHERLEVQGALLKLCIMVVEECRTTLQDSIPILIETVVVLADLDENQIPNNAYSSLKYLATTYPVVLDSLKTSLHTWLMAFPRTMQNNDEMAKQWAIKQISTVFQMLSGIQSGSDLLTSNLTAGLCDSVAVIVNHATSTLQPLNSDPTNDQTMEALHSGNKSVSFSPVLLDHRSQQQTLKDLEIMITKLNTSESGSDITRLLINRLHQERGNSIIAPLWLAMTFLKSSSQFTSTFDDFISLDQLEPSRPYSTRSNMVEELYYVSLPILNEPMPDESRDWRVSALALEALALQAGELREAFRPELMDALYPVLQLLASSNPSVQKHAMACLNILTQACNYKDTGTMIIENVDYLVNSVALKLNTFDVSPYPPQVLLMMVKLCGAPLVPYLDDLVDSIFGILDLYHGYPKLVELMFKTLAAIVEESTKNPSLLAIEYGEDGKASDHLKKKYERLQISTLAEDLARRKAKRVEYSSLIEEDEKVSHPTRPWVEERQKKEQDIEVPEDPLADLFGKDESDEPLPPPREPEDGEKPLSKPHSLLLHIVKSIPSHLSSPSPYLRRSLLSILANVLPVLAADGNSFLPLLNDLWPAVVSRISFPASFGPSSSSAALIRGDTSSNMTDHSKNGIYEFNSQEETFVTTTACKAVELMAQNAGDFMASRVENEFPRWERLYNRAWEKVRQDADKVVERRNQHAKNITLRSEMGEGTPETSFTTEFIQSLSLTKAGSASGSRAFTPHHNLWRAFISLFLTLLTHVRLPLSVGDRICELLGEWISRYAGATSYFSQLETLPEDTTQIVEQDTRSEAESVQNVLRAMETWNPDLTWFIFQEQKIRFLDSMAGTQENRTSGRHLNRHGALTSLSFAGGKLGFAEMVF
ncbi:hypothetical protein ARAM_000885 [Aspergillus rambellii]|uniref:HEAT repeat protein n=1 Tax=Aspergillus rambellii TaxID=308745 RepID=A0A0F8U1G8_9EURO|nr:hypothetical protein ARAM_000885 [Aspergillus rambellii]